jgi:hypothetical protein
MVGVGGNNMSEGGVAVDELLLQLADSGDDVLLLLDPGGNNSSNSSFDNDTLLLINEQSPYPSGHSMTHIIAASVVVTVMMIVVVVGNMLVIIAIATEKSLKNLQNWFIASLAVSDFFLGLVIMPFSLANELMGYWMFGTLWCDRRPPQHRLHHEPLPDQPRPLLVHHAGPRLPQEAHRQQGGHHDLPRLAPQRPHLHPAAARLEGPAAPRRVPQV